jgi:hypothetical protein
MERDVLQGLAFQRQEENPFVRCYNPTSFCHHSGRRCVAVDVDVVVVVVVVVVVGGGEGHNTCTRPAAETIAFQR